MHCHDARKTSNASIRHDVIMQKFQYYMILCPTQSATHFLHSTPWKKIPESQILPKLLPMRSPE